MSCNKHFLSLNWKHHDWARQVTHEETLEDALTDMWGRRFFASHVECHTRYVCRHCGKVRDERECSCEPERAESCVIRREYLANTPER